nr:hypothetical protein [uncultured Niameybacter sp.]
MNFKKAVSLLALLTATSVLYGCGANEQVEQVGQIESQVQEESTQYTVKVESIEGNTITAVIGELTTQDGPPPLPNGEVPTGEAPPALPEGEEAQGQVPTKPDGQEVQSQVPAKPEGQGTQGEMPPAKPDGNGAMGSMNTFVETSSKVTFTLSDATKITIEMLQGSQEGTIQNIGVNNVLEVTLDKNNEALSVVVKNLQAGGGFGGSHTVTQGTSANTLDTDSQLSGETYTSVGDDENALRIDSATVNLENITVEKLEGESSNTENGDFYGQNAALLATNGANVTIKGATVTSSTVNGNGIFSYGEGTTVTVEDTTIHTSGNNSGGIQTTGGGTTYARNLQVETKGNSAAAIRSDRGGGLVQVVGGNYTTNGTGSPAIYSTADITVEDAKLTANHSEAIVIEGKNSVHVKNSTIEGSMDSTHLDTTDNVQNIMIYQSMSGDAEIGHSTFTAEGGSILAKQGDMIYVTNTTCTINLSKVQLQLANDILLKVSGNESSRGWGTPGSNGGKCTLNANEQILEGKIIVDAISTLDMQLQNNTAFTGTINADGIAGTVKVTLDETSKWVLTGDSYITEFTGSLDQVDTNGHHLYVDGQLVK